MNRPGFAPLGNNPTSQGSDGTTVIPLSTTRSNVSTQSRPTAKQQVSFDSTKELNEKKGMFKVRGRRRDPKSKKAKKEKEDNLNALGKLYKQFTSFSIITRYSVYVLPIAFLFAIPIILTATTFKHRSIGGTSLIRFFIWLEIVWCSLWASKVFAHYLPVLFQFLAGRISTGIRKYSLIIKSLELRIALVGWAGVSLGTLQPLLNGQDGHSGQRAKLTSFFAAALASFIVLLVEGVIIQLISIQYHQKQFHEKIQASKHNVWLLGLLYEASRQLFPAYCNEFAEEDYIIMDGLIGADDSATSGTATPMKLLADVGRFGDKLTSVFGNVVGEVTGKNVFNPNSAHSIVVEALERKRSCEALAKRLWMSFVVEGKDALYAEDIAEVLGPDRATEAEECFVSLDRDGNGDISLDEMIFTVTQIGAERKSIYNSMHDVDQAINVLDRMLLVIVFIASVLIFIAFFVTSFTTTLGTAGTALLSLSFVFSVTAQEFLGSCIFLFVKHPFDVGDRVDLNETTQLVVEHISLLFCVFRRVNNGRLVQVPNIVLNSLYVENVSRSKQMKEQLSIFIDIGTSFEDIQLLKNELHVFVRDKDNNRDFLPDVEIEVLGIGNMDKMELRVEIRHKSNWANEALRASRRSKFMCALIQALRKVPINGPGGGDAVLGSMNNPTFSVAFPQNAALETRQQFLDGKDASRLVPKKSIPTASAPVSEQKSASSTIDYLGTTRGEDRAIDAINTRDPASVVTYPSADNGGWPSHDSDSGTLDEARRNSIEEVRGVLRRASTKGKRRPGAESPDASRAPYGATPGMGAAPQVPTPISELPTPLGVTGSFIPNNGFGAYKPVPQPPPLRTSPGMGDSSWSQRSASRPGTSDDSGAPKSPARSIYSQASPPYAPPQLPMPSQGTGGSGGQFPARKSSNPYRSPR